MTLGWVELHTPIRSALFQLF